MSKAAKAKHDFDAVYARLKSIMQKYERGSLKGIPYGDRPNSYDVHQKSWTVSAFPQTLLRR